MLLEKIYSNLNTSLKITKSAESHFFSLKTLYLHISQHDIRKFVKASNIIDTCST